ncbi:MAG: phage holin family protein [Novosphingobium sp.]
MDDDAPPLLKEPAANAAERSLVDDLRLLAEDGKTLLEAEFAYQKSRAVVAGDAAKSVAGWGALSLALVFFALMALVMGVLLGLAAILGAWAATVIVVVAVLFAALLSAMLARARWRRTTRLLGDTDPGE